MEIWQDNGLHYAYRVACVNVSRQCVRLKNKKNRLYMLYKYRRAVRKRGDFKSGTKDKFDIDKIRKAVYNVDVPKRRHKFFLNYFLKNR